MGLFSFSRFVVSCFFLGRDSVVILSNFFFFKKQPFLPPSLPGPPSKAGPLTNVAKYGSLAVVGTCAVSATSYGVMTMVPGKELRQSLAAVGGGNRERGEREMEEVIGKWRGNNLLTFFLYFLSSFSSSSGSGCFFLLQYHTR